MMQTHLSPQKWESYQENVSPGCISVTIGLVSRESAG